MTIALTCWAAIPVLLQFYLLSQRATQGKYRWADIAGFCIGQAAALTIIAVISWFAEHPLSALLRFGFYGQVACLVLAATLGRTRMFVAGLAGAIVYSYIAPDPALVRWWVLPLVLISTTVLAYRVYHGFADQVSTGRQEQLVLEVMAADGDFMKWCTGPGWQLRLVYVLTCLGAAAPLAWEVVHGGLSGQALLLAVACMSAARAARARACVRYLMRPTRRIMLGTWLAVDAVIWLLAASPLGGSVAHALSSLSAATSAGTLAAAGIIVFAYAGVVATPVILVRSGHASPMTSRLAGLSIRLQVVLGVDQLALLVVLSAAVFHPGPGTAMAALAAAVVALSREVLRLSYQGMRWRLGDSYSFFNIAIAAQQLGGLPIPLATLLGPAASRPNRFTEVFRNTVLAAYDERLVGGWLFDRVGHARPDLRLIRQFTLNALQATQGRGTTMNALAAATIAVEVSAAPADTGAADRWLDAAQLLGEAAAEYGSVRLSGRRARRLEAALLDEKLLILRFRGMIYQFRERYEEALATWRQAVPLAQDVHPGLARDFQAEWLTLLNIMGRSAEGARLACDWAADPRILPFHREELLTLGALAAAFAGEPDRAREMLRDHPVAHGPQRLRENVQIWRSALGYNIVSPVSYLRFFTTARRHRTWTRSIKNAAVTLIQARDPEATPDDVSDLFSAYSESFKADLSRDNRARTLTIDGTMEMYSGHHRKARRMLTRGRRMAERQGKYKWALEALGPLSELAMEDDNLTSAYQHIADALAIVEGTRDIALDEDLRMHSAGRLSKYYSYGVLLLYTYIQRPDPRQAQRNPWPEHPAIEIYDLQERAKSRVLLEMLGSRLSIPGQDDLTAREQSASAEYERLQSAYAGEAPTLEQLTVLRAARENLDGIRDSLQRGGGQGAEYADLRAGRPLRFAQAQALLARSGARVVLCCYYKAGDDLLILVIVRPDAPQPVIEMVDAPLGAIKASVEEAASSTDLQRALWRDQRSLQALAPLIAPLSQHVQPGEIVCFEPYDVLHYVPLHAIPLGDSPLIDRNPVCYVPNATTLWHSQQRPRHTHGKALVIIDQGQELAGLHHHLDLVSEAFGADNTISLAAGATRENVADRLRAEDDYAVVHFGCHGAFNPVDPLASGLQLSGGAEPIWWSASDFLRTPCRADLVVLSACDTGVNATRPGDELIGLTRSILYAGARSVLVSLWPVDQFATALLLDTFYRELGQNAQKAAALRAAQLAVRETTAQQIIASCQGRLDRHGGTGLADIGSWLRLQMIRAREAAGDHEEALRACTRLASTLPETGQLAPEIRRTAARCRRAARYPHDPDYQIRPYTEPFYWAAFILIGDWE